MSRILSEQGNVVHVDFGGQDQLVSKKRLAALLGRSTRWVELRVREGMPSQMDHGKRRFSVAESRAWLETQRGAANA